MQVCAAGHPDAETAETRYRTLATADGAALLEVSPRTGRMHQIRVHLASIQRPIAGDAWYGGALMVGGLPAPRPLRLAPATGPPFCRCSCSGADAAALKPRCVAGVARRESRVCW